MSLRFKPEVRIVYLNSYLTHVFEAACLWSLRSRVDVEVNSVDDGAGVHLATSLHGWSLAVDLDTVADKPNETRELAEYLRRALPAGYDVIFETDHVHVEYDTHRPPLVKRVTT